MKYYFLFFIFLIFTFPSLAQLSKDDFWNDEIEKSSDIIKPYLLSTHPLGIYISRLQHNFNVRSPDKYSFSFVVSSGNVILPYVKSYELTNPEDREASKNLLWYNREYAFNLNNVPSKIKEFSADGVIRSYRFTFTLPITTYHELNFSLRANSLDRGKYPFSVFTPGSIIKTDLKFLLCKVMAVLQQISGECEKAVRREC